jgi:uncharacterized membrane protein YphA (DoxX/SURF4 family)
MPRRWSTFQLSLLTALRVAIGWHFLYEGLAKLLDPNWSAANFLDLSRWVLAPVFRWAAAQPQVMVVVDTANVWALMAIGGCLMLGLFTRVAAGAGMALLALYYLAHPALAGLGMTPPAEGHYLIVNKNIVELAALAAVLVFPTGRFAGLDRWAHLLWRRARKAGTADRGLPTADSPDEKPPLVLRRELLAGMATMPFVGAFVVAALRRHGWMSFERQRLREGRADAVTSATMKSFSAAGLKELKGLVPMTKIGNVEISRMILGGNLIGGWAHARDLIYVDRLVKAYHHRDKVFETLLLAEKCGINALLTNPMLCGVINEYWRREIGKIKFISDCAGGGKLMDNIRRGVDAGACACYIMGGDADQLVRRGEFGKVAKALDLMRSLGVPGGIGAHKLATVKGCVDAGILPDFWMKTIHQLDYWSAGLKERNDSAWCEEPEETVAYMKQRPEPWVAFKILAAGAINPWKGFEYAFAGGADLLCVGMYDFQIIEDVNVMLDVYGEVKKKGRERPWRA